MGVAAVGATGALAALLALIPAAATTTGEVRLAPSRDGRIGAWLVAGPFDRTSAPVAPVSPRLGAPLGDPAAAIRWRLASSSGDGPVDLAAALESPSGDRSAVAAAVLHVEHAGPHLLLIGVDDGVTVLIDGVPVYASDQPRPERDDDDLVPVDLGAGDHVVALVLHGRGPAWRLRVRLLDSEEQPPLAAWWTLPGTTPADAAGLGARMGTVAVDRAMNDEGYRPVVTVRYREGAVRDVPLGVHLRLARATGGAAPLLDADVAQVTPGDRSVEDLSISLPPIPAAVVEDADWVLHADVAGRAFDFPFHPRRAVREAAAHAASALSAAAGVSPPLPAATLDTVEHLRDRLVRFVGTGDGDVASQLEEARELDELAADVARGHDPFGPPERGHAWRTGVMRRAYRSPVDGHLSEFAVYLPPDFDPSRRYPLIVALHGLNGQPVEMIMWLFGHDDPKRDGYWEDRHPVRDLPPLEAIVVAPDGHRNAGYRDLGEDDVMRVVDWAVATYPIDPGRVTVTGPSMGGIGTAACALHHPDVFAAAEPLCGYHSYFVRGDVAGRTLRPWERFLAERRSNVFWAENGHDVPLYIVHGTRDLPVENSGVLIDRYEELHYSVKHEHPDLGHNVWQTTYEDLKGAEWLLDHRRDLHPRELRFRTATPRWGDDAWLHVRELAASDAWGEVKATLGWRNSYALTTEGVGAIGLDRDTRYIDDAAPVTVHADDDWLKFQAGEPIELHRERGHWRAGTPPGGGPRKTGPLAGPIRDVFHEPLLFVWGASDPAQARANEEVARAWARVHPGVHVDYPLMSDVEFLARGESVANDRALFLVGNARSNQIVRQLEPRLPVRIDGDAVLVGGRRIGPAEPSAGPLGTELGAVFVQPNPVRPDRYVIVVEGVGPLGTWRSLSLPDLLPDYVVYDHDVAPARGQLLLGAGRLRAAGFFGSDWSLPP
jgi:poly(3-hydroxybutyrate) depolymerase